MGWRSSTAVGSLALVACTIGNPAYQESDGATASESGSDSDSGASFSSTGASTSASSGTTSGSASDSGDTSTGGETSGPTTGVTSLVTTSTTGETTGDVTTTGDMTTTGGMNDVQCDVEAQLEIAIQTPVTNTYVVTSGGETCQWKDSDNNTLNGAEPCDDLNFGAFEVRYTLVGEDDDARSEMLLFFDVHATMQEYPGYAISYARLELVPWWGSDRSGVNFEVGVVAYEDTWFQGTKAAQIADVGDSSWMSRKIDAQLGALPWSSGVGPAAGSTIAALIDVGELAAGDHPWHFSSPIAGSLLAPWVTDAENEAGLVVSTTIGPILIKNKDAGYPPRLHLTLCPK